MAKALLKVLQGENRTFEIVFVNDGSPDATWEAIQRINASNPQVRGINLMRNYGQHSALLAGIFNARHEVIVTMDDDFQTPPMEIPKLLAKINEGYDLVYGARNKEQHSFARNLASRVTKWFVQHAMNAPLARSITSFRAFRKELMRDYPKNGPPSVFIDALLEWTAQRVTSVPVEHNLRETGVSNYSWSKLAVHGVNLVTGTFCCSAAVGCLAGISGDIFRHLSSGLCAGVLLLERKRGARFHFPCRYHSPVFRRPTLRARHYR